MQSHSVLRGAGQAYFIHSMQAQGGLAVGLAQSLLTRSRSSPLFGPSLAPFAAVPLLSPLPPCTLYPSPYPPSLPPLPFSLALTGWQPRCIAVSGALTSSSISRSCATSSSHVAPSSSHPSGDQLLRMTATQWQGQKKGSQKVAQSCLPLPFLPLPPKWLPPHLLASSSGSRSLCRQVLSPLLLHPPLHQNALPPLAHLPLPSPLPQLVDWAPSQPPQWSVCDTPPWIRHSFR